MTFAKNFSIEEKLHGLKDYSSNLNLIINSYPGKDEELINKWTSQNHPSDPFYIKTQYGNEVGRTDDGNIIKGGKIFIVNPQKTSGILWWKKVKIHVLYEPDWSLFRVDSKPLKRADLEKLSALLSHPGQRF